ncbi:hypothetical protein [Actinokineospora spheciospongiae]|uniref:hypothetical protein n=1 Tax=Actinokineospora spheciospongiae TaxID=909613 RepID=UPI000D71A9B8|nr:hypothetical protein [Actinokineospora spheciospongiae]PWW50255.1 hypothetical protein DFQ13_12317 [Actinokineospora spheciospongiae]
MSTAWRGGSTRRWRKLRAAVLAANVVENGGRCRLALPGVCTGLADCVHHTQGRAVTGDDPAHMVAACTACNLAVGDPNKGSTPHRPMTDWSNRP